MMDQIRWRQQNKEKKEYDELDDFLPFSPVGLGCWVDFVPNETHRQEEESRHGQHGPQACHSEIFRNWYLPSLSGDSDWWVDFVPTSSSPDKEERRYNCLNLDVMAWRPVERSQHFLHFLLIWVGIGLLLPYFEWADLIQPREEEGNGNVGDLVPPAPLIQLI